MNRFANKKIIITGAASGIGRAAAIRIAAEGGRLGLLDKDIDKLEQFAKELKNKYIEIESCDVSNSAAVNSAIKSLYNKLGGINALSHNAGILKTYHTHEMTDTEWQEIISVNLNGTFYVNRATLPYLLENEVSYIVNASSNAEFHPHPWLAAYSATKGAIKSFTRSLFLEYHRKGLRANCIQSGSIQTPLANQFSIPIGGDKELLHYLTPFNKPHLVEPEHAASVIAFLCSDDALHVNGAEFVVDGGRI